MIDSAARVLAWARTVDAGRRTCDRHSGGATGRSSGWRSCAAGRARAGAGVVESVISARAADQAPDRGQEGRRGGGLHDPAEDERREAERDRLAEREVLV